eukprot:52649-Pelagomonas_calceolata.AAC.5
METTSVTPCQACAPAHTHSCNKAGSATYNIVASAWASTSGHLTISINAVASTQVHTRPGSSSLIKETGKVRCRCTTPPL